MTAQARNGTGVWKWIATTAVGIILAGAGFWVSIGSRVAQQPNKEEIAVMIQQQAPYLTDRKLLLQSLEKQDRRMDGLENRVMQIDRKQNQILGKLDAMR